MSNKAKIITAVILGFLALLAMGSVWVKDSRKDPGYCKSCHADPYYATWNEGNPYSLAHVHQGVGNSCQTCHYRTVGESLMEVVNYSIGNYYSPLPEMQVSMNICFQCHESYQKIIPLTAQQVTGAERNPHDSHWGPLECGTCHKMHRDSIDYCAACHKPVTDAPGWTPAPKKTGSERHQ